MWSISSVEYYTGVKREGHLGKPHNIVLNKRSFLKTHSVGVPLGDVQKQAEPEPGERSEGHPRGAAWVGGAGVLCAVERALHLDPRWWHRRVPFASLATQREVSRTVAWGRPVASPP